MFYVWILLVVLGGMFGIRAVTALLGVSRDRGGSGRLADAYRPALPAIAALGGMFLAAYDQQRGWVIVGSYVLLGLLVLYGVIVHLTSPPPHPADTAEVADRLQEYANEPGARAVSLVVQRELLAMMLSGKLTRYSLTDRPCLFCFVEELLSSLVDGRSPGSGPDHPDPGDVVGGFRAGLRRGPTVEAHLRRTAPGDPWRVELTVPRMQPPWESGFLTTTCAEHRPPGSNA